ncbi:hypothetical protein [Staphylococcus sp. GDY8P72P]|uniref:hypothetical protein n=1 Tax=Staphylococcus sp. GDY8P72P TaxID=2804425 RepID=UPI001951C29E|nr:hypothetical protein [Staphylococcus sp. GDY8P72P]
MNGQTVYTLIIKPVFTDIQLIGVYDSKVQVEFARANHMRQRQQNNELDVEDEADFQEAQDEYMILKTQLGKADILGIVE